MSTIKAIIIDDEVRAQNVLNTLLERNCNDIQVIDKCSNLEEGVKSIKNNQPEVVFLDIQMPNYNGYEIINFFDEITFEIIFVTAYDQYAIKAFELNALDYLVKPIDRTKLINSVNKLSEKVNSSNKLKEYELLIDSIKSKEIKKIILPELGNRRVVKLENIIAIEADGAYTKVHLLNKEPIILGKNLRYFENNLDESIRFIRTHRSWLINSNHIKEINKTSLEVFLSKDIIAKISRNKLDEFEQKIQ